MPHVIGSIEVYEQQTTYPIIMEHSDVVVMWDQPAPAPQTHERYRWRGLEFFNQLKSSKRRPSSRSIEFFSDIEFFGDQAR